MNTDTPPTEYTVNFMGIDRPSKAMRAMIDGLLEASRRDTFNINMATYGIYDAGRDICSGCAATCALMKLSGDNRIVKTIYDSSYREMRMANESPGCYLEGKLNKNATEFESCVDDMRKGNFATIFAFFGFNIYNTDAFNKNRPYEEIHFFSYHHLNMTNYSWKSEISLCEKIYEHWKSIGY